MRLRLMGFFIHLFFSMLVAGFFAALIFWYWYPSPLDEAVGVRGIFNLILIVNVLAGPMLTFFIFKAGKKSLLMDLLIVVAFQICFLAYGLFVVAMGRPAWLVFNADRFDLVQVIDIDRRNISDARLEYQSPSWFGPVWVAARPPEDSDQLNTITFEAVYAGVDIAQRPNLYLPLAGESDSVRKKMRGFEELRLYNSDRELESIFKQWPEADAWLPLMSNSRPVVVLLRRVSGTVVAVVDLNPWPRPQATMD